MVITYNFKDGSKTITLAEIEEADKGSDFTDFGAPEKSACFGKCFFISGLLEIHKREFPTAALPDAELYQPFSVSSDIVRTASAVAIMQFIQKLSPASAFSSIQ